MSQSFRRFLALPMGALDTVRNSMQSNPKTGNYAMMMGCFFTICIIGNGADTLTCSSGNLANSYETYRLVNRGFVPYWLRDYSYRHP